MLRRGSTVKRPLVRLVTTASLSTSLFLSFLEYRQGSKENVRVAGFLSDLRLSYQLALWFFRLACLLYLLSGLQCYASWIGLMLQLNLARDNSYKMLGILEL